MDEKTQVVIIIGIAVIMIIGAIVFQQVGVSHCTVDSFEYCEFHGMEFKGMRYNPFSGCSAYCTNHGWFSSKTTINKLW